MSAESKKAFSRAADAEYAELAKSGLIVRPKQEDLDELFMLATLSQGAEHEKYNKLLEQYGIYEYKTEEATRASVMSTDNGNVTISRPVIYYDSTNSYWAVCTGGYWNNETWRQGPGEYADADAFGVKFYNVEDYNSIVVYSSAYITDQNDSLEYKKTTSNRYDGASADGFGFRLQDESKLDSAMELHFIGAKWFGMCCYDDNFSEVTGTANSYYVHTWDSASITSINLAVPLSAAITIENQEKSIRAFSDDVYIHK